MSLESRSNGPENEGDILDTEVIADELSVTVIYRTSFFTGNTNDIASKFFHPGTLLYDTLLEKGFLIPNMQCNIQCETRSIRSGVYEYRFTARKSGVREYSINTSAY